MNILSYNPGHDGAIAYLKDGHLMFSIEAEKNSNYRYSAVNSPNVFSVLGELDEIPDIICTGGWWPCDHYEYLHRSDVHVGYRGLSKNDIIDDKRKLFGKTIHYFSSSHERSHILCSLGMSNLPKKTPCYALVWEGDIGAFYEIDDELNITLIADVLDQVGNRYALLYGLADPFFPKNSPYPRLGDAGKLMALASFSNRRKPFKEDEKLLDFLIKGPYRELCDYENLESSQYYNVGLDDLEFRNFTGIFSDRIFDLFYQFAKTHLKKGMPLIISGGCGLNCDWNTKWVETDFFSEVFVPPVANDSGSAIGTAIDAQIHYTGNSRIDWNVYSGKFFDRTKNFDSSKYDYYEQNDEMIADMLASGLILGWVSGKYEIGPRALGNRSILAAPFKASTRTRLNNIKQREQFRPIAPVCLEEDALRLFGCNKNSPYMLYTYKVTTESLAAVSHVNKTARIQTVSSTTNPMMYNLLKDFKAKTGYGVLCNTSLNFQGKGFINKIDDLSEYTIQRNLDGFVIDGCSYILKSSKNYQVYLDKQQLLQRV